MRAARVLDMLFTLQRRGRTTARELAALLEVSERTILRDVEVLGEAGVPIFTTRGARGGIELMDGFQTRLTGLTTIEAQSLFLAGRPRVARRLGLGTPARSARNKLLAALTPTTADEAEGLSAWFVDDPDPWGGSPIPDGELRRLAGCIHRRREVEVTIGDDPTVTVRPLGLALKAGAWHLVCAGDRGIDVLCVDELRATRITRHTFTPPPDFDLAGFWDAYVAGPRRRPRRYARATRSSRDSSK